MIPLRNGSKREGDLRVFHSSGKAADALFIRAPLGALAAAEQMRDVIEARAMP